MKTKQEIEKRIADVTKFIDSLHPIKDKSKINKNAKEITFLRSVILYLETNPKEEVAIKTRDKIKAKIKMIDAGFSAWKRNTPGLDLSKSNKGKYHTEMGMKSLKIQLRTFDLILQC